MRYWVAYRECGCVEAVAPETVSMIPQGADCEFVRQAVAHGLKTRLTAEGEHVDIPSQGEYIACPEHAAIWPALNPLEEKPGKGAAQTPGPACKPLIGTAWGDSIEAVPWYDMRTGVIVEGVYTGGGPPALTQDVDFPSGAGESERRGMEDGIEPLLFTKADPHRVILTVTANGQVAVERMEFPSMADAARELRALADALDGGQKRRQKKAKE